MLPIHGCEYNILGAIWPFAYQVLIYDMGINEDDVVDPPFFGILAPSSYTIRNRPCLGVRVADARHLYVNAARTSIT